MSRTFQPLALELVLPWEVDAAQEEKFEKCLKRVLVPLLLFLLVVLWLPDVDRAYEEPEEPVVKTKILLEPKIVELPKPKVEPPKKIRKIIPKKPAAPQAPKKVVTAPAPAQAPAAETREDFAAAQGLGELSSELSALRSSLDLTKLQNKNVSVSTKGNVESSAKQVLGKDAATMVGTGVVVDDADMRNDTIALADHNASVVEGILPAGGGTGASQSAFGSYRPGLRDMESIRRTLEQTKSRVYSMYLKALQANPDLAGHITFTMVIEPSGEVSKLVLVASGLGAEELEREMLAKIKSVNFGAKDVSATSLQYTFNFLPS